MPADKHNVKVNILQREFTIACEPGQSRGLTVAAAYLNEQMQAVARSSKLLGAERCAIMAALNMAYELLELKDRIGEEQAIGRRLDGLYSQVDQALVKIK